MDRMPEALQEQQEQQHQEDEMSSYLWSCLQGIRGHISTETYRQAERELGFQPIKGR